MLHSLHVAFTLTGLMLHLFAGAETKSMSGPIMSVSESQVLIQKGTESVTFFVTRETKVSLNGKEVKVSELKMNDQAELSAVENGDGTFKALTIKATRSDKQPTVPR
ncbi:hypothetical protein Pan44_08270 [Caulifigura coniformis]|uniref:DUF5666 domain-containing protein n=1 Tax=Caulifigura coniformis TaxID=2527983 RepID=A0A517S9L8_9PLAN|nr:hypothetical protein [Caulifigura coniformis]QDT52814.1 hypothetical protein Pan44_08270 [Caulifigura coniformis]